MVETTTRGEKMLKEIEDDYRTRLAMAKEVRAQLEAQADEAIATNKQKLDDHIKEAKEAIAAVQANSAPFM